MTPEQAKAWAAEIARDAAPGAKGEPAKITKDQAQGFAATIGACLAASDPATGFLDSAVAAKINAGRLAALAARDADSAAFTQCVAALGPASSDAAALQAGAQQIKDAKGQPIDAKLQADLDAAGAAFGAQAAASVAVQAATAHAKKPG